MIIFLLWYSLTVHNHVCGVSWPLGTRWGIRHVHVHVHVVGNNNLQGLSQCALICGVACKRWYAYVHNVHVHAACTVLASCKMIYEYHLTRLPSLELIGAHQVCVLTSLYPLADLVSL